ncbi:CATRA system-associated protein [Nonomuraea jabiensis]|uniref:CATRA system-associated protein n=1 Tax=Nonomuraea jabiensis TaxID=882448 RepID=UPI003D712CA2
MDDFDRAGNEVPVLDAEATADALDVLNDLPDWELAPARWERVHDILGAFETALHSRDSDAAQEAIADLELSGPVRATRIGTALLTSAPQEVRDRRNRLVHSLGGNVRLDQEEGDEELRAD